jgi:uncharacterized protein YeaO (DUF488 family)
LPVKTKSIYEPAEPEDGVRVLVTRYYPRGVKKDRFDQWVRPLSPSSGLLSSYRDGKKSWDEFKDSFLSEMNANPDSREAIRKLNALSKGQNVTLLCYERSGLPCHRQVIQEILSSPGILSSYLEEAKALKRCRRGDDTQADAFLQTSQGLQDPLRRIRFYSRRKVGRKAPK